MNKRIQELAEQAGYKHPDAVGMSEDYAYFSHEKFAELIVREYSYDCMDVTSNSEHIQFVAKKWGVEL
jgi:cupin superfamily acireductone dioxygenase involved in methionine salvage